MFFNYINIHSLGQASRGASTWGGNVDGLGKKRGYSIPWGGKRPLGWQCTVVNAFSTHSPGDFQVSSALQECSKEGGALERKHSQGNKVKAPWSHWQLLSMCSCNVVSPNSSCSGKYGTLSEFQL